MPAGLFYAGTTAFALGVFLRSFLSIGLAEITLILIVAGALAVIWHRRHDPTSTNAVLLGSIVLCFCALGILRMEWASWFIEVPSLETMVGSEIERTGTIIREPDVRQSTQHLYIETETTTLLAITDPYAEYAYGDRVEVSGELTKPESFETDLGRTFDYPGYLHARDVSYLFLYPEITVTETNVGNGILEMLFAGKQAFMHAVESVVPEPQVGLGEGLLLGEKRALGDEWEEIFRRTGIIHIVVLSGYNVMLVVTFVMYICARLFGLRLRVVFGIIAITIFALLVGPSATVVRASVMASLLLVAQATGHTYAVMRALVFAGCCMLLINPYLLAFDTGFQLSFVATAGLVLLAPMIERFLHLVPTQGGVREFVTATIATQIFVLPILLYQIGEFSVVAVFANVLVLPVVALAMLLTGITGLVALITPSVATIFAYPTYLVLQYILFVAHLLGSLPFAAYAVPAFPFWLVVVAYCGLGGALLWWYRRPTKPSPAPMWLPGWTIVDEQTFFDGR